MSTSSQQSVSATDSEQQFSSFILRTEQLGSLVCITDRFLVDVCPTLAWNFGRQLIACPMAALPAAVCRPSPESQSALRHQSDEASSSPPRQRPPRWSGIQRPDPAAFYIRYSESCRLLAEAGADY